MLWGPFLRICEDLSGNDDPNPIHCCSKNNPNLPLKHCHLGGSIALKVLGQFKSQNPLHLVRSGASAALTFLTPANIKEIEPARGFQRELLPAGSAHLGYRHVNISQESHGFEG